MVSEHFSVAEMACRHCGRVTVSCELMAMLEKLRRIIGQPLPIRSGYRCARHNRSVGGAARSQHVLGRAADLPRGLVLPGHAVEAGARGIGTAGPWVVHVDVRTGPTARWRY